MKRIILACAGLTMALSLVWIGVAHAANVRSGASPRVTSDEVIDGSLYAAGTDIKIQGTVQGDVFCAGQNVEIEGVVEGDVLCAAQNITVSGHVQGDLRVAAQVVTIRGKVDGSASAAGQNIDLKDDATIARDVTLLGSQMEIAGTVGRDIEAMGGTFRSSAKIGRDLDVTGQQITLERSATIAGMFMYVSEDKATVEDGAQIAGKTEHKIPDPSQNEPAIVSPAAYFASILFTFGSFLLIGLALLVMAPRAVKATATAIKTSPVGTLGAGFMGLVLPPIVAVILFLTIVGIPLGVVLLLLWIVSLLLGMIFTAQVVGQVIFVKLRWQGASWQQYATQLLGLLVLFLLALLPVIGGFVMFAAVVWGLGAQWHTVIKSRTKGVTEGKKS